MSGLSTVSPSGSVVESGVHDGTVRHVCAVCSVCICIWAAWAVLCGSVSMPLHAPTLSLLLFVSTPHPCSLCACCMAVEKDWGSTSVLIVFLSRWHEFSQWSSAGGLGPPTEVVCQIFAL